MFVENEVFILSKLKKSSKLNAILARVSDALQDLCNSNGFYFLCNDVITSDSLWQDKIHLKGVGTHILRGIFSDFLNRILFDFLTFNSNLF